MHESYDDNEDDNYSDDDYNYDYKKDPYKWYYKFDVGSDTPISEWLNDMINKWVNQGDIGNNFYYGIVNIPGFPTQKFPVSSWNPNTENTKFQYLGSNYQGSPIWKYKYFVRDKIQEEYIKHLQTHASHFIQQPVYYKGLFDIVN